MTKDVYPWEKKIYVEIINEAIKLASEGKIVYVRYNNVYQKQIYNYILHQQNDRIKNNVILNKNEDEWYELLFIALNFKNNNYVSSTHIINIIENNISDELKYLFSYSSSPRKIKIIPKKEFSDDINVTDVFIMLNKNYITESVKLKLEDALKKIKEQGVIENYKITKTKEAT